MSLNTAHANGSVLLQSGECILLHCVNTTMDFTGPNCTEFKSRKLGRIYLTTHRVVFIAEEANDPMQSFSFPFMAISKVELVQPVIGANYITGKVRSQPNENWVGEVNYKLVFRNGGAVEFAEGLLRAATLLFCASPHDTLPFYEPPPSTWYDPAPPAIYTAPPLAYYGWIPRRSAVPWLPPVKRVFVIKDPPGINDLPPLDELPGPWRSALSSYGESDQLDTDQSDSLPDTEQFYFEPDTEKSDSQPDTEQFDFEPDTEKSDSQPDTEPFDFEPDTEQCDSQPDTEKSNSQPDTEPFDFEPDTEQCDSQPDTEKSDSQPDTEPFDFEPDTEQSNSQSDTEQSDSQPKLRRRWSRHEF